MSKRPWVSHYYVRSFQVVNEFTLMLDGKPARQVVRELADRGVLGGVSLGRLYPGVEALEQALLVAVTETTTEEDIEVLATQLAALVGENAA